MKEIPFQSFDIVNVEMVGHVGEVKTVEFPMASLRDIQTIVKSGHTVGWRRMLELPLNKDRYGFGFSSHDLKKPTSMAIEGQVLPLSDCFSSIRHLVNGHICALEEDDEVEEEGLIYQRTEGRRATSWIVLELPEVTMLEK